MNFIRTFSISLLAVCLLSANASAQHPLDRFVSSPLVSTTIGTMADGLNLPVDLDFCRVPGRTHELWVLNKQTGNSSMSIFFHAGTPEQVSQYRMDSHSAHFMVQCPAFAMAANGNFATVQEVQNSVGNLSSTFMGPVLWMSDTSVFARYYQSNWETGKPLGSHIDMLHQSPYAMGIAAEKNNIYWVFDGYNGNLCKYDFATPHVIGGDDHSDGRVWRYPEIELTRIPDLPAHMVFDTASGWLYIVDNANARIIRVNTKTGVKAGNLTPIDEPLALYWEMKNVTWQVYIDTGLEAPVGIDYWNGRLLVTDNANSSIRLYDATGSKGLFLGKIQTDASSIMGVKIGPDSNVWYVDAGENTVTRLRPTEVKTPAVPVLLSPPDLSIITDTVTLEWQASQDATYYEIQLSKANNFVNVDRTIDSTTAVSQFFGALTPLTTYYWRVRAHNELAASLWSDVWSFTTTASSVRDEQGNFAVQIFPNPMHSSLSVMCTLSQAGNLAFELVNALGIPVQRGSLDGKVGINEFTVARGGLAAGSYLLRVQIEDKVYTRSIVILP